MKNKVNVKVQQFSSTCGPCARRSRHAWCSRKHANASVCEHWNSKDERATVAARTKWKSNRGCVGILFCCTKTFAIEKQQQRRGESERKNHSACRTFVLLRLRNLLNSAGAAHLLRISDGLFETRRALTVRDGATARGGDPFPIAVPGECCSRDCAVVSAQTAFGCACPRLLGRAYGHGVDC